MTMVPFDPSFTSSRIHLLVHSLGTRHRAKGRGYAERTMGVVSWREHDVGKDKSGDRCNEKGQALCGVGMGRVDGEGEQLRSL